MFVLLSWIKLYRYAVTSKVNFTIWPQLKVTSKVMRWPKLVMLHRFLMRLDERNIWHLPYVSSSVQSKVIIKKVPILTSCCHYMTSNDSRWWRMKIFTTVINNSLIEHDSEWVGWIWSVFKALYLIDLKWEGHENDLTPDQQYKKSEIQIVSSIENLSCSTRR